jgi:hypothetical protein
MPNEKPTFTILSVIEWNYAISRVIGSRPEREKDTPKRIELRCHNCGMRFVAHESESGRKGTFLPTLGAMQITCLRCGAEDTVPNASIPRGAYS